MEPKIDIAAVARPGDTILISFDRTLDDSELADLDEAFSGLSEQTGVHIGIVEGASSMAVVRPEGGER